MKTRHVVLAVILAFVAPVLDPAPAQAHEDELAQAYKKEFAYLKSQKDALQKRLGELDAQTQARTEEVRSEIDRLQGRLMSLTAKGDRLEEQLNAAQREATLVEERSDALLNTMQQARATLGNYGVEVAPTEGDTVPAARVEKAFDQVTKVIADGGDLRSEQGAFFLKDGTKVDGELVHVGRVASYGVSDKGSGALAPAGEGRLKLWNRGAADTARAFAAGNIPETVEIFLYESLEKPVEAKEGKTLLQTVQAGGIIAWVIVGLGLLALLLVLWRSFILLRAGSRTQHLVEEIDRLVAQGRLGKAIQICREAKGATAAVLVETLAHLDRDREALEDIVSEAILRQTPRIERFGAAIMVFAAVAPLLGLLGTVTGMISTFDIITEYGTGDPKLLSGGISEALITTQLGLVVAIPLLLVGNLLNGKANSILDGMEHGALQVINIAELKGGENLGAYLDELEEDGVVGEARGAEPRLMGATG